MFKTLKDYFDEFQLLPNAVKGVILTVILFLGGFAVYYGVSNFYSNLKIERLEKQNRELNSQAQSAIKKAAKAETNAANESLCADSLEADLKTLEAKTTQSDEKIKTQSQKSTDLRLNLNRVRSSQPANIGTNELERKLCERYGCR